MGREMAEEIEVWRWEYYDDVLGRRVRTRYHLSEADALAHFAGKAPAKLEWSREVRKRPEQPPSTSDWLRKS
jgi:hypothetical protein